MNFKSFKILFIPFFFQFSCLLIDLFQFFFLIFVKDKQKKVLMLMMKTHRRKIIFYRLSDTLYLLLLWVAALLCCDQLKWERNYYNFEVTNMSTVSGVYLGYPWVYPTQKGTLEYIQENGPWDPTHSPNTYRFDCLFNKILSWR